ncbi:MAG: response regulator, partial [Spirochaetota bacterium]
MNDVDTKNNFRKEEINKKTKNSVKTILIMDDEIFLREVSSKILKSLGYNFITTVNGEEALKIFRLDYEKNLKISGLLLDLTIQGGLGGKDIIDEIRKINSSIPVIVTSGYADDPIIAKPHKYGITASISKPFTRSELDEI